MKITNISYRIKSKHGAHNKIKELPVKWWKKREKGTELVTDASWFPRDLLFILDGGPSPQSIPVRMINRAAIPRCSVSSKEPIWQCRKRRRPRSDPWVRKIPRRREQQPTPVFLPGEFYGQRSLAGYSPWGHKESLSACAHKRAHTQTDTHTHTWAPSLERPTGKI